MTVHMKNLVTILISVFLLALGIFFINQETHEPQAAPLGKKIDQDLRSAQKQNFFPSTVQLVSKIRITIHTKKPAWKETILSSIILPFEVIPKGEYSLQIDAIENFTPASEAILILQFNLFENSTQNKKWEASRIYHLDKEDLTSFTATSGANL